MRQGLRKILEDCRDWKVVAEAANGRDAVALTLELCPGVAIFDIAMPLLNGIEAARQVVRRNPNVPVLILSMHPEDQFAVRLLKAGAAGYLTKESAGDELVGAIKKVVGGGRYISPALAERMASYLTLDVQKAPHERLSDREFLILRMFASGKQVSQIAKELSLSVSTVSTYRARILEKMDMKNNAELTRYALKRELVD
jgi:DNA-binding NarL/FixJ family response regulator